MDVEGRRSFWGTMRELASRGKTILFATHYLEEADAYADRAVLMAAGRIVADGPTTEIKAMVGARTIRATLPEAELAELGELPGVSAADRHGRGDHPELLGLRRRHPGAAGALSRGARHRDRGRGAGGGLPRADRRRSPGPAEVAVSALAYTRFEFKRTLRNRRFFVLSLGFPVILYFLIAGPQRSNHNLARQRHLRPPLLHGRHGRVRDHERDALQRRRGSRPSGRRAGPGSCGSALSLRAPISARRC